MADMTSIIAGIDGYRRYEQNRALDVNNEAQALQNRQAGKIMDLKSQLEALQTNPYAKYNIWDPVGRRQQLLSEDDQLKIASKWASSIKNLAPENREAGYKQFLRAMPGLGIDVSDMPQGYDEGYINMIADLGIGTETRYQNEQQNSRLERQIEANREARQDEFDKRLAAFDYENNYKTKAEKDKQLQIDNMIDASSLSPNDKERAKLAYRNITLPNVKTPQERLMDVFTNPDSTDEQRETARQELRRIAEFQKEIKSLEPVSLKDFAQSAKYLKESGADTATLNRLAEENGFIGNFENLSDFDEKLNTYNKSKEAFPDMPESFHRKIAGISSYADEAYGAGMKAGAEADAKRPGEIISKGIDYDNSVRLENQKQANRIELEAMKQENKLAEMNYQNMLNMNAEAYKATLPTQKKREIEEQSQATGIPVEEIVKQDLAEKRLEAQNKMIEGQYKLAQMQYQLAQVEKLQKEMPYAGMTETQKNALAWQNNPELRDFPGWSRGSTTVNIDQREEQEYNKQMAKQNAEAVKEYRKAGNDAASTLTSIDNMIKAIKSKDIYQGTGGGMINSYKRFLSSMGKDVKGMSDAAILDSGKSLLLGKIRRDVMSGTTSDRDIQFLVDMVPNLGKTREQNLAIAEMYKKVYQRQVDAAKFVNDYIRNNNGRWNDEGEVQLFEYLNRPIFSDAEKAKASGIPLEEIQSGYDFANTSDDDLLVF